MISRNSAQVFLAVCGARVCSGVGAKAIRNVCVVDRIRNIALVRKPNIRVERPFTNRADLAISFFSFCSLLKYCSIVEWVSGDEK